MKLATRSTVLSAGDASIPVLEIRRLTQTGHQTAIITTPAASTVRWSPAGCSPDGARKNFFAYMMQHYDIDGLVQYGDQEIPGTVQVVNPAWRTLDKAVKDNVRRIRKLHAQLGAATLQNNGADIQSRAETPSGYSKAGNRHGRLAPPAAQHAKESDPRFTAGKPTPATTGPIGKKCSPTPSR